MVRCSTHAAATGREVTVDEARREASPGEELLAGKYLVEAEIASGGMGHVMRGRHVKLGRAVAIKMIRSELLGDAGVLKRFYREARAAAALRSRHVAQVLDIDTMPDGEPFIVMELLQGADLGSIVARSGPLAVADVVRYALETCEAIAEAHASGIVHRDLTPRNLFLAEVGESAPIVKVLDFGLAKALPGAGYARSEHTAGTATHSIVGSPQFMSPEQMTGTVEVDGRTDIWSLGATLYYLLSGKTPFGYGDFDSLRARVHRDVPVPLREHRAEVPEALDAAIRDCLQRDVRQRWQTVEALAQALASVPLDAGGAAKIALPPGFAQGFAPALPLALGRYTLLRRIASGGMGTVYLARARGELGFSRTVAVKHLHAHLAQQQETRRRFLEEARVVSHIKHPHVVSVLDVVRHHEHVFLVLDYVHGEALQSLLRIARETSAAPPLPVLVAVFVEMMEGLHAAHEARDERGEPLGLVHRDVSPHNILVSSQGVTYVTDFGIAKVHDGNHETSSGVLGKSGYMAPEQLRGEGVSRAADIYAAGVVIWEALTGRRLFDGHEDRLTRIARGGADELPPPSSVNEAVPPALDALVLSMLAHAPSARPRDALVISTELATIVPPATSAAVGDWVCGLAQGKLDRLEEAQRDGAEVEPEIAPAAAAPSAVDVTMTTTEVEKAPPSSVARKTNARRFVRIASVAAIAVVALTFGFRSVVTKSTPSPLALPKASATPPAEEPRSQPLVQPLVQPLASEAPAGEPPPRASAPSSAPQRPVVTPRGHAAPKPATCDQPFVLDSAGIKRYNRACFGGSKRPDP